MIRHIRFHGRGGEGVKLASHIVTRSAFLAGFAVQDSPLYGAERRGAPVVAFGRIGDEPIRERGYIEKPDAVVLMDASLLDRPEAAVMDGVDEHTILLANSPLAAAELSRRHAISGHVVSIDVSSIALDVLQRHLLSAPMAGFTVHATGLADWDALARAVEIELAEAGVVPSMIERNLEATKRAFEAAPVIGLGERPPAPARAPGRGEPFVVPRLPARIAAPSISAGQTSLLRSTEGWRVYRPVIDLSRCTRCFLCFALCPEGAIHLDEEAYPHVDYQHCKGCLVCVEECPTKTIEKVREAAA
jgi:pyruvate ferredoxin oxidoreductase gamma subunit